MSDRSERVSESLKRRISGTDCACVRRTFGKGAGDFNRLEGCDSRVAPCQR